VLIGRVPLRAIPVLLGGQNGVSPDALEGGALIQAPLLVHASQMLSTSDGISRVAMKS